jgi:enterochelin esterase-like enzyme
MDTRCLGGKSKFSKQMGGIVLIVSRLWAAAFAATILFGTNAMAQEPQALVSGMNLERTLSPGENQAYTITLQEGGAVVGEADQHGIDLVIDVFGPDGKLIRTVDSPNGTEGPEPIDVIAFQAGLYRLVIHTLDPAAKPGKYVMKIERVLTLEENGRRMAEKNYPPALQALWRAYLTDPRAVENFVANRKGKGPIVEDVEGDARNARVTYLYYGDESADAVETAGGPHAGVGGIQLTRFMRTPLFFASEMVPKDARYRYGFGATQNRLVGPAKSIQLSEEIFTTDALNPETFAGLSVLAMPNAPAQPYIVKNASAPQGKLTSTTLKSAALKEDRTLTIYTPPGYDGRKDCELLILFDGDTYGGGSGALVPTPTILDNLIAANKVNPTVAVFVPNMGHRNRDLAGYNPSFADFIATEVVSWARKTYRIAAGPSHVVVVGSSLGGVAAGYCAFTHSEAIGNVLSQSGAFWVLKAWQDPNPADPWPLSVDSGDLISQFKNRERLPIRFYLEVGRFDQNGFSLGTNRELRDVLQLKGYAVTYKEFDSGHDYIWWRGSLADGLIALLAAQPN